MLKDKHFNNSLGLNLMFQKVRGEILNVYGEIENENGECFLFSNVCVWVGKVSNF